MFAFVVVAAEPGRACPPEALAVLHESQPPDLPFRAGDHVVWHDDARSVWFAAWQPEDRLGIGPRWTVRPTGVTAFGGFVWHRARPWGQPRAWVDQFADLLARQPLAELAPDLDGVFTAVSLGADGTGCVTADPLGMSILTRAETADVAVVSNRAALAARVVAGGARPARDLEAAGWMIYQSTLAAGRTGFRDVRRVPEGSVVTLGPGRPLRVDTWDPTPWVGERGVAPPDVAGLAAATADRVRALLRLHAEVPSWQRTFELTGGHDSRLLLALLVEQGLVDRFSYVTWGSADLPDVRIARQLAERFDLHHLARSAGPDHRRDRRPPVAPGPVPVPGGPGPRTSAADGTEAPTPDYEQQLRHHVWATSGARSLWDRIGPDLNMAPSMSVSGVFGELLRSTNAAARDLRDGDDLRAHVQRRGLHGDQLFLLHPEVRRHHHDLVTGQVLALHVDGRPLLDALDGHYVRTRLREWFGAAHEHDNRNRLYPLCSLTVARAGFAVTPESRVGEELAFAMVRGACDELARLTFAGEGWPEPTVARFGDTYPASPLPEALRPSPPPALGEDPTLRRWARRLRRSSPRPVGRSGNLARIRVVEQRDREVQENLPVLRSLLDLDRNHPLFDLVDRKAARSVVEDLGSLGYYGRRAVHDLVTAAIWLDHGEAPFGPGAR